MLKMHSDYGKLGEPDPADEYRRRCKKPPSRLTLIRASSVSHFSLYFFYL